MSTPNPVRAALLAAAALTLAACTSSSQPTATPSATSSSAPSSSVTLPAPASATAAPTPTRSAAASSPTASATDPATTPAAATKPTSVWPTFHNDNARSGVATNVATVTGLKVTAAATLDGAIYASPVVVKDAKGDLVITATENDTLYGLRDDGSVVWKQHVGTPVNGRTLQCGDINPTGITGTPVYDPATGLVFAVAFETGDHHVLYAFNAETGTVAWSRPVDAPGSVASVEQQRGALLLVNGTVWTAYGGLYGDCGPYHGYLVGISTSGSGTAKIYEDPTTREGGFWAPTGPAADAAGHLYVPVGNGAAMTAGAKYDLSDGLIELNGTAVLSYFAPTSWPTDNAHDYGTTGVVLTPDGHLFINGKSGIAYLLKQGALGGITNSNPNVGVCRAFGGPAYSGSTAFVPCTDGLRAVHVSGSTLTTIWHATPAGSPIIGGGVVLAVDANAGTLYALNPTTGAVRFTAALGGATTRFATPSMSSSHVYVGTSTGRFDIIATS